MSHNKFTSEFVADRGKEIYHQQIQEKVESEHKGKFLSVDIKTGDYEIDTDDLSPTMRLLAKRPDAIIYSLRIGFEAAHRIGYKISIPTQWSLEKLHQILKLLLNWKSVDQINGKRLSV